jgi:hypothetical protein
MTPAATLIVESHSTFEESEMGMAEYFQSMGYDSYSARIKALSYMMASMHSHMLRALAQNR